MGTRSLIGYIQEDGSVIASYCHYDGYPKHNGRVLVDFFESPELARKLVDLGYMSGLDPNGDLQKSLDDRVHDDPPQNYTSVDAYYREACQGWTEYAYLFIDDRWLVASTRSRSNFSGDAISRFNEVRIVLGMEKPATNAELAEPDPLQPSANWQAIYSNISAIVRELRNDNTAEKAEELVNAGYHPDLINAVADGLQDA